VPLKSLNRCLALALAAALLSAASASAKSPIAVAVADQSPAMFASPAYRALHLKRTRYFVASDVMQDGVERAKARAFVTAARAAGVSTLLHVSTSDLRPKRGPIVSPTAYRRNVGRIVAYFRKLGVRDFGAWNEVNHKTEETWNRIANAVSYFKSMYGAVHARCTSCSVVGLDVLDQVGVERYIASFYKRLSSTWRKRLKVVGIHNYSDVNRGRSTGTSTIIRTVRRFNSRTRFWFTETGALASFGGAFHYSESRQASRMRNMFTYATRYRAQGVDRVYSYNWFGVESGTGCGAGCRFDAGLVDAHGAQRPVYAVFAAKLRSFSR
jgi:isopentenyl diphosphate isomerase/L-lactate dehydrogenase-like FMN-dependent dehydrogenase